ncbi:MAG: rod shape-determining protein MreD [Acidimicrobiia bacterium]
MSSTRQILISLGAVLVAVLIQTTLFRRVQPYGVAPDLVLLVVIGAARWLDPEPAVLLGFTGGLLLDLLGSTPLGLRALVMTLVAFGTLRFRRYFEENPITLLGAIGALSLVGVLLLAVIGTLFGERTFSDVDVWRRIVLVPAYNVIAGIVVLPLLTRLLRPVRTRGVM